MNPALDLEQQRALAAEMFPREWAKASALMQGEKRRRRLKGLRDAAVYELQMRELRAAGRSCATCDNFSSAPHGITFKHVCDAQSDFHGYAEAKPDGLCPDWRAGKAQTLQAISGRKS